MVKSNLAWPKLNGKKIKMVSGHSIMQYIATVTESLMNLHKVLLNSGLPLICCHAHCHCYWDYDPRHHHYSQFLHYSRCSQAHYLLCVFVRVLSGGVWWKWPEFWLLIFAYNIYCYTASFCLLLLYNHVITITLGIYWWTFQDCRITYVIQ